MLPALDLSSHLAVAPSLVVTSRLLRCNLLELPQYLLVEAANNLTLQLSPVRNCPRCGFPLGNEHTCALCARQPYLPNDPPSDQPEAPDTWEKHIANSDDWRGELLCRARLALNKADHPLAEFIVAALDEHGLLSGEVTATLPQSAERVLRTIQSLDPPGIAARDVAECFRLQLQRLNAPVPEAVYRLIERWPDLPGGHKALAGALQITPEELNEAIAFMRARLRPYPVMESGEAPRYRWVDVAMLPACNLETKIEIIVAPGPHVRVSDDPATLGHADLSPEDWHALAQQGRLLERALAQRQQMIKAVFEEVARRQAAFLQQGPRHHRPLTRARVANALGVHASTLGRAVADKLVLIPSGQIIPATTFFERGVAIKHAIKDWTLAKMTLTT